MKKIILMFFVCFQAVVAQNPVVTAAEYFWGTTDPGAGNGIALSAEDGQFNERVENIIASQVNSFTTQGPILFNIRVKDGNNQWGPTFKKVVFVNDNTFTTRQIKLTKFEYFFGNFDPGEGNGTTIVAFDGALDEAVETVFRNQATWDMGTGPILFNIRARDVNNIWGPLFKKTVFPFGANPNAQLIAEGDSIEICPGSSVTLTYNGPNGYTPTWFDGSQENTITFIPDEEGSYTITATLENSTYTDSIDIIFKPQPTSIITPSGQVLVCGSSNFTLQANTGTGLSYQWFLNGNAITNATNATHLPTAIGSYTVRVTDAVTSCSKVSEPTVLASSFLVSPSGNVNYCGSQLLSVPFGSTNTYQWRKDGVQISGANSNVYNANQPGVYNCVVTSGSCTFTTTNVTLNQIAIPPIANSTQSFNSGDTLANLTVTGVNLQWYNSATGGTLLPINTILISGTTYYVSQTINGCESERIAITVTINLSTNDVTVDNFKIYPNPLNDFLNFKSTTLIKTISIYNMLGQLVHKVNPNAFEGSITLEKLAQGTYIVKINDIDKAHSIIKK